MTHSTSRIAVPALRPLPTISSIVLTLAITVAVPAHARPPASAEEDVQQFTADKGLLDRIGQVHERLAEATTGVRERITATTSELVVTAMAFIGVPYRRGGSNATTGFDCSGFVRAIHEQTVGLVLPRRASEQAAATQAIPRHDLRPGDLVFFNTLKRTFSHVGIYVGDHKFIHSPKPGAQVRVEDMRGRYWSSRFDGARRVVAAVPAASAQPDHPSPP